MPDANWDSHNLGKYADLIESGHADTDLSGSDRQQVVRLLRSVSKGFFMTRGRAVLKVDEQASSVSRRALLRTLDIIRHI